MPTAVAEFTFSFDVFLLIVAVVGPRTTAMSTPNTKREPGFVPKERADNSSVIVTVPPHVFYPCAKTTTLFETKLLGAFIGYQAIRMVVDGRTLRAIKARCCIYIDNDAPAFRIGESQEGVLIKTWDL